MKILLAGYYGYDNLGDELLCETVKEIVLPYAEKLEILDRRSRGFFYSLQLIIACDVLIFGGGSLLQDISGRGLTVLYYVFYALTAKFFKKKVFFIGQGIGPVTRKFNYWLVKKCLRQVDYLTVRNKESAAFLMALNVKNFKIYNDLFYAYKNKKIKETVLKENKKISVVFSFRPLNKDYHQQMHRIMKKISEAMKYISIKVVPMHKAYDENFLSCLEDISGIEVLKYDREKIFSVIAAADIVVGMRYHFLLLAAKLNIPFIGLVYDPKIAGICSSLNMPSLQIADLDKVGALLIREIPKIKINKQQLKIALQKEEKIAEKAVKELQQKLI